MSQEKRTSGVLRASWKIARFQGVDIRLHFSLFLILPYLILVTKERFPILAQRSGILPEDLALNPVVWGLIFALFLFCSILVHEMGHVTVALRQGVKVRSITLMMLGGVADMESMPENPKQEFRLALIGPIVSLVLSGIGLLIFKNSPTLEISFGSLWFSQVNLVLALFNLLPAFPLDGGRAFRSLLALRMGQLRATQVAAKITSVFAWVFGIIGIFGFNIFLVLIAFFLYAAAQSEIALTLTRRLLRGLLVKDVMHILHPLSESDSLEKATGLMLKARKTVLPVSLEEGAGLLSLRQIQRIPSHERAHVLVGAIADKSIKSLEASEPLEKRLDELAASPEATLPVCQAGAVVGLARYSDLADIIAFKNLEETQGKAA